MRARSLVATSLVVVAVAGGCAEARPSDPPLGASGFQDDFDRETLGDAWRNTGGAWRIENGELVIDGARNHPLWLRRTLPRDARFEFDVRSEGAAGDIKAEFFGDGTSHATTESYTATSYVVIFGGWQNSVDALARMDEHAEDRVARRTRGVERGRTYHMRVERRGSTITAWVDDRELVTMNDSAPLVGAGHDHFAFNDWTVELHFDNLRITPL